MGLHPRLPVAWQHLLTDCVPVPGQAGWPQSHELLVPCGHLGWWPVPSSGTPADVSLQLASKSGQEAECMRWEGMRERCVLP